MPPNSAAPIGAADRAKQGRARGGDTQLLVGDRVLHGHHQDLHDHAEAGAQHQHVSRGEPRRRFNLDLRQARQRQRHQRRADDRKNPVAADAADDLSANDRGDEHAEHHRRHVQAGAGGIEAFHHLEVDRQQRDGTEQGHADDEADAGREHERAVLEERQRQQRVGHQRLGIDERGNRQHADECNRSEAHRSLADQRRPEARNEDDRRQRQSKQRGSGIVDRHVAWLAVRA